MLPTIVTGSRMIAGTALMDAFDSPPSTAVIMAPPLGVDASITAVYAPERGKIELE